MKNAVMILLFIFQFQESVHAQGGVKGGGSFNESDLQLMMNQLNDYLATDEGRRVFPEVVFYDELHPHLKFKDLVKQTYPVVQSDKLKDQFGNVRDCVSVHEGLKRYFVCSQKALHRIMKKGLEAEPKIFRLVLHELFVQAGIERSLGPKIPSQYQVSSRIEACMHREGKSGWVLGKLPRHSLIEQGMWCSDRDEWMHGDDFYEAIDQSVHFLFWLKSGALYFFELKLESENAFKKGQIHFLFRGHAPLPLTTEEAQFQLSRSLGNKDNWFVPIHGEEKSEEGVRSADGSLFLKTNQNLLLQSVDYEWSQGVESWSQVPAVVYLKSQNDKSVQGFHPLMLSCQGLQSWPESSFFPHVPPIEKWVKKDKSDLIEFDFNHPQSFE